MQSMRALQLQQRTRRRQRLTLLILLTLTSTGLSTTDVCKQNDEETIINSISPICSNFHLLSDSRGYATPYGQCRTLCPFETSTINTTSTSCNPICTHPDTCIPHNECISNCGSIPSNCIYSGSCGSIHCFPTKPYRLTYAGPGSVMTKDQTIHAPPGIPSYIQNKMDSCSLPLSTLCNSDSSALGDGRLAGRQGQCRALCGDFKDDNVEVVAVESGCGFCRESASNEFWKVSEERNDIDESLGLKVEAEDKKMHLCIDNATCEKECGEIKTEGCIYSGSCETIFCFSDVDSKAPGIIENINDDIQVHIKDNNSRTDAIDPPIFSNSDSTVRPSSSPISTNTDSPTINDQVGEDISSSGEPNSGDNAVCIAVQHLNGPVQKIYRNDIRASVLCDTFNNCATPSHVIRHSFHGTMPMRMYCRVVKGGCVKRIKFVNSPVYSVGARIQSHSRTLTFTAFATPYHTKLEHYVVSFLVHLGL